MGLSMYLTGSIWKSFLDGEREKAEGYPVQRIEVSVGEWRKHRRLHGYIVKAFADGVDECQKIELDADACRKIAKAVMDDALPPTEGFFFGNGEIDDIERQEKEAHAKTFEDAANWIDGKDWKYSLYYQASW